MKVNVIRSKMTLLGMSQAKVADKMGISVNTMSSRMQGHTSFTLKEVARLCEILEIQDPEEQKDIFFTAAS